MKKLTLLKPPKQFVNINIQGKLIRNNCIIRFDFDTKCDVCVR